jgi:transcriptional regulator with XRE-family HTH domain
LVELPAKTKVFAEWLAARLDERGVLPSQAAAAMDIPPSTVERWLAGVVPRPPACYKIAAYLKRDPDEVLARAGHRITAPAEVRRLEEKALLEQVSRQLEDIRETLRRLEDRGYPS